MKPKPIQIAIKLSMEDADTLLSFIQGSVECADDEDFCIFGRRIMRKINTQIKNSRKCKKQ